MHLTWEMYLDVYPRLRELDVAPGFAVKLLVGLPDRPGQAHAVLVCEVLGSSSREVIAAVDGLVQLESTLSHLCRPTTFAVAETQLLPTLLMRQRLWFVLWRACRSVDAQMPPVWPWLVRMDGLFRQQGRTGRPSANPVATLLMTLIADHLDVHRQAPQYAKVGSLIEAIFPEERETRDQPRLAGEWVRRRIARCRRTLEARGVDQTSRLAAVHFFFEWMRTKHFVQWTERNPQCMLTFMDIFEGGRA